MTSQEHTVITLKQSGVQPYVIGGILGIPRAANIDFDKAEEGMPLHYYFGKAWDAFWGE